MNTTQHVRVLRPGGPERLVLRTIPLPSPGPGQVRVAVEACGVAFADIMVREGRYPNVKAPVTPGYDLVGRIDAIGDSVTTLRVGQRVAALTVTGGYARHAVLPAEWAVPAPEALEPTTAVSIVLNYVTAWQMLFRNTAVAAGDTVLVHGAAGGVGTALLELCRMRGIRAFGTASLGKHTTVAQMGGIPIDYATEDFVARVRAETDGQGVDAVFDHLGGAHIARSYDALRATGVVLAYGGLGAFRRGRLDLLAGARMLASQPKFRPLNLLHDNKAVVGFDIAGRRDARPEFFAADLSALFDLAEAGQISPVVAKTLPLAEARSAHELLGRGEIAGKIVLLCM